MKGEPVGPHQLADEIQTMLDRQMSSLDSDGEALKARLAALQTKGIGRTKDDALLEDRLKNEVAEIDQLLLELSRQRRDVTRIQSPDNVVEQTKQLKAIYSQLSGNAATQSRLADSEESMIANYYASLRSAVERRPAETPKAAVPGQRADKDSYSISPSRSSVPSSLEFILRLAGHGICQKEPCQWFPTTVR